MKEMTAEEYFEWLGKFEKKYTTDECFTPPAVYETIKNYVVKFFGLEDKTIERPFYPDGDDKKAAESYDENTVVIDNPPFSRAVEILTYYNSNKIRYFLFANLKTSLGLIKTGASVWFAPVNIEYSQKESVATAFVTNLEEEQCIRLNPDLVIRTVKKKKEPLNYPMNVYNFSHFNRLCRHGLNEVIVVKPEMVRTHIMHPTRGRVQIYGSGIELPTEAYKRYLNSSNSDLRSRETTR